MTPGTHDLVARLREHARCLDLANEPAGATEARDISDALAALPPPADQPALVALVAEWRQAVTAPLVPPPEMDDNAARTRYRRARSDRADAAHKALLAYPLPAAPPVPATPQGELVEEIASQLWMDLCEGDGQHSESLDKALIRKHLDRLAAAPPVPAGAESARAWLMATKPDPREYRGIDGDLPTRGGGTAGYLSDLQRWNEAREFFEAKTGTNLLQKVSAPPVTDTPQGNESDDDPTAWFPSPDVRCITCGHLRSVHLAKRGRCLSLNAVEGGSVPCACDSFVVDMVDALRSVAPPQE